MLAPARERKTSVSAMGKLYRAMAMSRLFSSPSATASESDSMILPSFMSWSRRGVLAKLGSGTFFDEYGAKGFGQYLRGFRYPTSASDRVFTLLPPFGAVLCGAGAFGIESWARTGTGPAIIRTPSAPAHRYLLLSFKLVLKHQWGIIDLSRIKETYVYRLSDLLLYQIQICSKRWIRTV